MRVGILSQFGEKQLTGVSRVVAGVVRELKKINNGNEYYYLGKEPFLNETLDCIDILYTNKNKFLLDLAVMSRQIDIVHSFYYAYRVSDKQCKQVITIHDLMHFVHPEWFYESTNAYFMGPLKEMANKADAIIAVSLSSKRDIIECYGIEPEKISVVYPGLYPQEIYEQQGVKPKINGLKENNYILSVAAIHEYKNQTRLIKAFAAFKNKFPDVDLKLVLAGNTKKEMNLSDLVDECNCKNDIILTGFVSDEELIWLYKNSSLFVYVSLYEGFGLPILEALTCERPVICSNVTSMPEVGGDAVYYCNPYDVDAIEDAIEKVLFDEELKTNMINKAKLQASKFSYAKAAKEIIDVYNSVCLRN